MELKDAFKGTWLVLVIVLPTTLAIIAGALYLSSAPESYAARSIISIREVAVSYGTNQTSALIDDFDSAMQSERVGAAVAEAQGTADPTGRITVTAVGNGADVAVAYEAPTSEGALLGLEAGTREALLIMSESELRQAQRRLASSQAVADETTIEMQALEELAGGVSLTAEVDRRSADILSLRNQIAASVGQDSQESLRQVLAAKVAELEVLGQQLLPWEEARTRFDNALQVEAQSSLDVAHLQAFQLDLIDGDVLRSPQVLEQSQLPGLMRTISAAGIGAAAVIVLAALASGAVRNRASGTGAPAAPAPRGDDDGGRVRPKAEYIPVGVSEPYEEPVSSGGRPLRR